MGIEMAKFCQKCRRMIGTGHDSGCLQDIDELRVKASEYVRDRRLAGGRSRLQDLLDGASVETGHFRTIQHIIMPSMTERTRGETIEYLASMLTEHWVDGGVCSCCGKDGDHYEHCFMLEAPPMVSVQPGRTVSTPIAAADHLTDIRRPLSVIPPTMIDWIRLIVKLDGGSDEPS